MLESLKIRQKNNLNVKKQKLHARRKKCFSNTAMEKTGQSTAQEELEAWYTQ